MSKALIGLAAIAGLGAWAFYSSKANAGQGEEAPLETVTGQSGAVYGVRLKSAVDTANGRQLNFQVFDASGLILEYAQFQGDNNSRILVATPDAVHPVGDIAWTNAVTDFGIFTSVAS